MKELFRPGITGNAFNPETGKLYLFKPAKVQVMTAWPTPMAWEKSIRRPVWKSCRPEIHILCGRLEKKLKPPDEKDEILLKLQEIFDIVPAEAWKIRQKRNLLLWANQIPFEIRELTGRYPKRHWHMLSFLARCGNAASDLVRSNPALAFALASNWVFHKPAVQWPMRASRSLLKKKQRDILEWLGFPRTKSARKILSKVKYPSIQILPLLYLRQTMLDPDTMKILAHLPVLNKGAIHIISDPNLRKLVSPYLINMVAQDPREDYSSKAAWIMHSCKQLLELLHPGQHVKWRINSLKSVDNLAKTLRSSIEKKSRYKPIVFPPPPVEGSNDIHPIKNSRQLFEEAKMQNNCVGDLITRIYFARNYYLYRVLKPERCTLALSLLGDEWSLYCVRGKNNKQVSPNTLFRICQWLENNGVSVEICLHHTIRRFNGEESNISCQIHTEELTPGTEQLVF